MNKRLNLQTASSTKEVVHIDDSGNSGNKTPARNKAETRRPTINKSIKPPIQRTVISTPKFSSLQRKLNQQTPKAVPGTSNVHIQDTTPTTTMYTPLTPVANSQQPAVSQNNIIKRKTPARVSLSVPSITKSNERMIPIITEAPAKVILNPGLANKSEAANGHLYLSGPQVSHLLPAQISITPLAQAKFIQISSPKIQTPKVTPPSQRKYQCSRCKQPSQTPELCDNCQSLSAVSSSTSQVPKVSAPSKPEKPIVPKRPIMTKEKFYGNKSSSPSVTPVRGNDYEEHANPRKVFISADTQGKPRGRPKGSKNRIIEPECLTIESSDEEQEAANRTCQVSPVINTRKQLRNSYNPYQRGLAARSRGAASRRYSNVKTSTDSSIVIENEDNEIIEDEEEEEEGLDDEEDVEDEEDGEDSEHPGNHRIPYNEDYDGKLKSFTLLCRSIRIGSFKIHPLNDLPHLSVLVSPEGFSFRVSKTTQASELVSISLKAGDIAQVLGHFGRCLPIIFIFTTPSCAARIRLRLGMVKGHHLYYDPELADEKQKRITFLIDNINDNMKTFLRNTFPGDGILKEIDQKQANEILVKSTPNQQVGIRNSSSTYQSPPPAPPPPPPPPTVTVPATLLQVQPIVQLSGQPLQSIVQSLQPHVAVTVTLPIQVQRNIPQKDGSSPPKETIKIERPSSPVRKIVTYPPPPEPDNIELNNVDLACLEEGEFLNDKIIDFYLRYLSLELIPEEDRERTHVFNSYFYRGLTQKLQKRASEDRHKTIAEMRHRQVKKWTKNLDIFEKDFIIIPINQNVHWFLAIICYPKLASEGKKPPKNSSTSHVKKTEESNSLSNNKSPETSSSGSSISVLINTISPVKTREQTSSTNDRRENNTPDYFEASEDEDDSPAARLPPDVPNIANAARPAPGSKMPFIIVFDSLQTASRQVIGKTLKEYLEWEWKSKKGTTGVFDTASVLHGTVCVPQQTNYSDCGIYVLQYVQSFFEDPFPYIAYPLPDMRNWFDSNKVSNKRKEIKDLIYDLEKRQSPPMASTSSNSKPITGRVDNAPSPNSSQSS